MPNKEKWSEPVWALWSAFGCATQGGRSPFLSLRLWPLHGIPCSFLLSWSAINTGLTARHPGGHAQMHEAWPLALWALVVWWEGGRNEAHGSERIRTSMGPVAEEPNGWCEITSGRDIFLAGAAVSRWGFAMRWGRRPVF